MARPALLLLVAACAPASADEAPKPAKTSCVDDAHPYDEAVLRDRLSYLASAALDGRAPGTAGDLAARAFIAKRFACLGLQPAGDGTGYEQAFGHTANIVGYIPGESKEIVVIGAHHDHLGDHHLGANDNASGVVALLSIAQAMQQRGTKPKRTIAFIAFGAEEQGMVGSYHFVAHPPAALPIERVVYDINLDMLGSYKSKGFVAAMGTFAGSPGRTLMDALDRKHPKLHVGLGGRGVGSDHLPFCKRGVPYVFFWTPDGHCYHEPCDTADKIDMPHYAEIAQLAGELVDKLVDSDVDLTASRDKRGCGQ
jgi:Peptidase family M28